MALSTWLAAGRSGKRGRDDSGCPSLPPLSQAPCNAVALETASQAQVLTYAKTYMLVLHDAQLLLALSAWSACTDLAGPTAQNEHLKRHGSLDMFIPVWHPCRCKHQMQSHSQDQKRSDQQQVASIACPAPAIAPALLFMSSRSSSIGHTQSVSRQSMTTGADA